MHSKRSDLRTNGPAVDGLSRDIIGYPMLVLAVALVVGNAAASAVEATLLVGSVALTMLAVIVILADDDQPGRAVRGYARGTISRTDRLATALTGTIGWCGVHVVALAVA